MAYRSISVIKLMAAIEAALVEHADPEKILGCWVDYSDGRKEPLYIEHPNAQPMPIVQEVVRKSQRRAA